jgi:hypothetical protein
MGVKEVGHGLLARGRELWTQGVAVYGLAAREELFLVVSGMD